MTLQESLKRSKHPFPYLQNGSHLPASLLGKIYDQKGSAQDTGTQQLQGDTPGPNPTEEGVCDNWSAKAQPAFPLLKRRWDLIIPHDPLAWLSLDLESLGANCLYFSPSQAPSDSEGSQV